MTRTRKYVLTGAALTAMAGAGGATALAAEGGPATAAPAATGRAMAGKPMMSSMKPTAMGRTMAGMGVKLDKEQLAAMGRAHDKMMAGMMSGSGMRKGG